MLYIVLAAAAAICAGGWFFTRISIKIILYYMQEKGCTLPTDTELKACSRKAVKDTFTFGRKNKR